LSYGREVKPSVRWGCRYVKPGGKEKVLLRGHG